MLQGQTVVLLVDDDGPFLDELQDALSSSGYVAVTVQDASIALEAAQEIQPDVILVDYRLRKADGLSIARGLRHEARTADIPTILMSGYITDGVLETDPRSKTVNAFLQKPFTQKDAVVMIETVLTRKRHEDLLAKKEKGPTEQRSDIMRERNIGLGSRGDGPTAVSAPGTIALDYPQEGETVRTGAGYTFRVSAPAEADAVELCIGKEPWQECRQDGGYWWYDWSGFAPGKYQARARLRTPDGHLKMTLLRKFQVKD
ncbi:MAG: response regulator [Elusimicrobiota bacterium]